jgi:HAD superfamily hydrolase (TIGR01509 family)
MTAKGIIFDCDGTLVDSEVLSASVLSDVLFKFGVRFRSSFLLNQLRGRQLSYCLQQVQSWSGQTLPKNFVNVFKDNLESKVRSELKPIEGAFALLESITAPYAVASSSSYDQVEIKLRLTGLLPFLKGRIYSSYDIGSWKPEPDILFQAAKGISVAPNRCIVVEDNLVGVEAALNAGMRVILLNTYGLSDRLLRHKDVTTIKGLQELIGVVR